MKTVGAYKYHDTDICIIGGIANENPLMMQIYADVPGLPLHVRRYTQAPEAEQIERLYHQVIIREVN